MYPSPIQHAWRFGGIATQGTSVDAACPPLKRKHLSLSFITLRGIEGVAEAWHTGDYNDGESDEVVVNSCLQWFRKHVANRGHAR